MKKQENILVTGAAGFIGFHLCKKLVDLGFEVTGLDNLNDYYDVNLKLDRLKELGFNKSQTERENEVVRSSYSNRLLFVRMNLQDRANLPDLFAERKFTIVCNLAAQAGVRYSLENPEAYIDSNLVGFANLLECCRTFHIKHLVYASSSSVYGQNEKVPFSVEDNVDHPVSLYAATKKSNELMAYTYSHLYNLKVTGIRFFTVYGPWGRPDMAMFLFTDAIIKGNSIKVFNHGHLERDFTYIDDIVEGVSKIIMRSKEGNFNLYNIGNSTPVKLLDFIEAIEKNLGRTARKEMLPMQQGDVYRTWANVDSLKEDYNYSPNTSIAEGVSRYVTWYCGYYNIKINC